MGDLRQIKKRAGALLDELGHDPDEVAASLHAAGVRGDPRSNSSCAIAVYTAALMRTDPRIRSVAVGPCTLVLTLAHPDGGRPGGTLTVQLPKAVRGFVTGFDAQQYPDVIRGSASGAVTAPVPGLPATGGQVDPLGGDPTPAPTPVGSA
jgi:hypothetical protein